MQVAIFIGSPRKEGNTFTMGRLLAKQLNSANIVTEIFDLYEHQIQPCIDCRGCKSNKFICLQTDGMRQLYSKMEEADVLVFGTPIYWFGPSGQTKLMIDRFRPYFVNKKLYGKKGALLLPSATGKDDSDLTIEQFTRLFKALGMDYLGAITLQAYDEGDAMKNDQIHDLIRDLRDRILESEHNVIEK